MSREYMEILILSSFGYSVFAKWSDSRTHTRRHTTPEQHLPMTRTRQYDPGFRKTWCRRAHLGLSDTSRAISLPYDPLGAEHDCSVSIGSQSRFTVRFNYFTDFILQQCILVFVTRPPTTAIHWVQMDCRHPNCCMQRWKMFRRQCKWAANLKSRFTVYLLDKGTAIAKLYLFYSHVVAMHLNRLFWLVATLQDRIWRI